MTDSEHGHPQSTTSRVEAFSDGVMAIAITLLVLNLHIVTLLIWRGRTARRMAASAGGA